jgi:hypothetical protein
MADNMKSEHMINALTMALDRQRLHSSLVFKSPVQYESE